MKCKLKECRTSHNGWHYFAAIYDRDPVGGYARKVVSCAYCNAVQSLGPANDAGCVAIEIRAARLAAEWDPDGDWNGFESLGMVSPEAEHAPLIACSNHQTWVGNWCWDSVQMSEVAARVLIRDLIAGGWTFEEWADEGPFADLVKGAA